MVSSPWMGRLLSRSMSNQDAVSLTRDLLRFDTINPPGRERDCAHMAGALLKEWGYEVEYFEYADTRTCVVARAGSAVSDMKSGVAAILLAARSFADKLSGKPGIVIVLTAGEEGGCVGSAQLA